MRNLCSVAPEKAQLRAHSNGSGSSRGSRRPVRADKIRLYAEYLRRMERALQASDWLVGQHFTMADVAMAPYVNRLAALAMEGLWGDGRLPRVADWFERIQARPAFGPAFVEWMPPPLAAEMRTNGLKSWPEVAALLGA